MSTMAIHIARWRRLPTVFAAALCAGLFAGCTGDALLFGPAVPTAPAPITTLSGQTLELEVSIAQPITTVTAAPGAAAVIQWTDIVTVPGTSVRVIAQRQNDLGENIADPIHLIGDGTVGSGRDAQSDGGADIFEWDVTGIRVGDYVITVILESPDGMTATAVSRDLNTGLAGVLSVITALPVPTLTFNEPGADTEIMTGDTFDITWNDNGNNNPEALVTLGLDTDADHANGNEIILLRDDPLSNDGNAGLFTFAFFDEQGATVPDGSYTVFATVDDGVNDPIEAEAPGLLVLNP